MDAPTIPDLAVPAQVQRDAAALVAQATVDSETDGGLTAAQRAMLDFERRWWRAPGAKEQAIRDTFGLTPVRYYQDLNGVLTLPAAMHYDGALVQRLLRVRSAATRTRHALE